MVAELLLLGASMEFEVDEVEINSMRTMGSNLIRFNQLLDVDLTKTFAYRPS